MPKIYLSLVLLIAACGNSRAPANTQPHTCRQEQYQDAVGKKISQLGLVLNTKTRVISPRTVQTTDNDPGRTNFFIDATGKVLRVTCG